MYSKAILVLLALVAYTQAIRQVYDDDKFLNWDKVNLGCTARCATYWACFAKGFKEEGSESCNRPDGCNCDQFADDDQEFKAGEWAQRIKKGYDIYKQGQALWKEIQDDSDEKFGGFKPPRTVYNPVPNMPYRDDDQFLNWDNVNPGCTVRCSAYWTCFAKSFKGGDSESCTRPSGCNCDDFADDDDEKFKPGKWIRKADKGYRLYRKGRKFYKSFKNDDERFGGFHTPHTVYNPIPPRHPYDDDQFLNWNKVNPGCTARCAAYWTCFAKSFKGGDSKSCSRPSGCNCDKFADDDQKFNLGKWARKARKGYRVYNQGQKLYKGLKNDDERFHIPHPIDPVPPTHPTFPRRIPMDDDQFLNFKKVNLGCTLKCGNYWNCFRKQFNGDANSCKQPSGCDCNQFA